MATRRNVRHHALTAAGAPTTVHVVRRATAQGVRGHPVLPDEFGELALRALERVLADDSELKDLWEDAGDSEWLSEVEKLRAGLTS